MAKGTGIGWTTFNVDDAAGTPRGLRSCTTNLDFSMPMNTSEVTGLDKSGMERLGLLRDLSGTISGVFDPGANLSHAVFSGDLTVIRTWGIGHSGVTLSAEVLLTDYALTRAASGEFTTSVPFVLADGTVPTWA